MALVKEAGGSRQKSSGPQNAQQAIAAQADAKRAAANTAAFAGGTGKGYNSAYGGGPLTNPTIHRPAAGGTYNARSQSRSNPAPVNRGYTPGGFDDPSIDWGAIYSAFFGAGSSPAPAPAPSPSPSFGGGGSSAPSPAPAPPPAVASVMEQPATFTAPPAVIQPPASAIAEGAPGAPQGQSFETLGQAPGTFGGFQRLRNQRQPRSGLSMTPEMLRRAAASRLG